MKYDSHVFWYFAALCQMFPKDSELAEAAFIKAHYEFLDGIGALESCFDYISFQPQEV